VKIIFYLFTNLMKLKTLIQQAHHICALHLL